jgi:hypothetical protein
MPYRSKPQQLLRCQRCHCLLVPPASGGRDLPDCLCRECAAEWPYDNRMALYRAGQRAAA